MYQTKRFYSYQRNKDKPRLPLGCCGHNREIVRHIFYFFIKKIIKIEYWVFQLEKNRKTKEISHGILLCTTANNT